MKGRMILRLVLAAVIVASVMGSIGTAGAPAQGPRDPLAGRPCVSDADCPGGNFCCPISHTCINPKNCKKDPL